MISAIRRFGANFCNKGAVKYVKDNGILLMLEFSFVFFGRVAVFGGI
jgi:hypothetical protein